MPQQGSVVWTQDQWRAIRDLPQDTPIQMINLIRLRDMAEYPAEHPKHGRGLTGLQAYRDYGLESAPVFARLGGRQVWLGRPEIVVIGPQDETWDLAFIAEYPNFAAFREMQRDPAYAAAAQNRTAAVLDSRLIRCRPLTPGPGFGLGEPAP